MRDNKLLLYQVKALGGSTIQSNMRYTRAYKPDFNRWVQQSADGWSFEDVMPYYMKSEDNCNDEYVSNGYHGVGGPLSVCEALYQTEVGQEFLNAVKSLGQTVGDVNGPDQAHFMRMQLMITKDGRRVSAAKAFLTLLKTGITSI